MPITLDCGFLCQKSISRALSTNSLVILDYINQPTTFLESKSTFTAKHYQRS